MSTATAVREPVDPALLRQLRSWRLSDDLNGWQRAELDLADQEFGSGWWLIAADRRWFEQAATVAGFARAHGRLPSNHSKLDAERLPGQWLAGQRKSVRGIGKAPALSVERLDHLDAVVPGWRAGFVTVPWCERAAALVRFRTVRGRFPTRDDGELAARVLSRWLLAQRRRWRRGELAADRVSHLDTVSPGWSDPVSVGWVARAAAFESFVAEHGRMPVRPAPDASEAAIAGWAARQLVAAAGGKGASAFTGDRRREFARVVGAAHSLRGASPSRAMKV